MCSVKHLFPLCLAVALGHEIVSKNKYIFRKIKIISCLFSYWKILTPWIKTNLVSSNEKTDVPEKKKNRGSWLEKLTSAYFLKYVKPIETGILRAEQRLTEKENKTTKQNIKTWLRTKSTF